MQKLVYDLEEVSELLGVPVSTLRWWRKVEKGPVSFRMGRKIVYTAEDVRTWLDSERQQALASAVREANAP
jgi:predicted site-specific integrase-resolvase